MYTCDISYSTLSLHNLRLVRFPLPFQIDLGDATEDMSSVYKDKYPQIWDDAQMDSVYVRHLALAKSPKNKVVADFLREVSAFGDYGVEYHRVLSNNGKVLMIQLGVKDLGIFMDEDPTRGTKLVVHLFHVLWVCGTSAGGCWLLRGDKWS